MLRTLTLRQPLNICANSLKLFFSHYFCCLFCFLSVLQLSITLITDSPLCAAINIHQAPFTEQHGTTSLHKTSVLTNYLKLAQPCTLHPPHIVICLFFFFLTRLLCTSILKHLIYLVHGY